MLSSYNRIAGFRHDVKLEWDDYILNQDGKPAMTTLYEKIGQKIRELREAAQMSQSTLAAKLEIAPNTVSRWETGTYKVTPDDLDKLARLFKVSITFFFPELAPQADERMAALTSATGGLSKKDFDEVIRYAEYRRVRQAMEETKKNKKKD